jgi:hypothetical protein
MTPEVIQELTPQVIMYDVKSCRNCRDGHKYDNRQTCKNHAVLDYLKTNTSLGYDPQISVIDGEERGFVFDHITCNFHKFRSEQAKHSYAEARLRIIEYSERIEDKALSEAKKRAESDIVERYGIVIKGRKR